MDRYGRPQSRRNTSPNVLFLNETRPKSAAPSFAAPRGQPHQDEEEDREQLLMTPGPSSNQNQMLFQRSRPPNFHEGGRPQSSGVRRIVPDITADHTPPLHKQRPSTARESRTVSPFLQHQSLVLSTSSTSDAVNNPQEENDERYILQLKVDILQLYDLLPPEATATPRSQTHVKTIQSMRENKSSPLDTLMMGNSTCTLRDHLERYSYSPDSIQLRGAKLKLEGLLTELLTKVITHFISLHEDLIDPACDDSLEANDLKRQQQVYGCGYSSSLIYSTGFLAVLGRVEKLRNVVLGHVAEKKGLQQQLDTSHQQIDRLNEQLMFFKDALAMSKIKRSGSSVDEHMAPRPRYARAETSAPPTIDDRAEIDRQLAQATRLHTLERECVELRENMETMQRKYSKMEEEKQKFCSQWEESSTQVKRLTEQLVELTHTHAHEQVMATTAMEAKYQQLEMSLTIAQERLREVEETAMSDKKKLQREKADLESTLKTKDHELQAKTSARSAMEKEVMASLQRANQEVESLTNQVLTKESLHEAMRIELESTRSDTLRLQNDFQTASNRIEELVAKLASSKQNLSTYQTALQQTELRLNQTLAHVERQASTIQHHENQLQMLEIKLSQSVPTKDLEAHQRRQQEDSVWHQKVAALEHALASERQHVQSIQEQTQIAIAAEQDKTTRGLAQANAIAIELEAAHLCLAERKKQREKDAKEFEETKSHLLLHVATLEQENEALRTRLHQPSPSTTEDLAKIKSLEMEIERLQRIQHELEIKELELRTVMAQEMDRERAEAQRRIEVVVQEREMLQQKLQAPERMTPRGSVALSETRVELQKAKLKITALEEKLEKMDSSKVKDLECKAGQISAREQKLANDHKAYKKLKQDLSADRKQLIHDRECLDSERSQYQKDLQGMHEDKHLLQQCITLLVRRLSLQMEMIGIIPLELTQYKEQIKSWTKSFASFLQQYQNQDGERWRTIMRKWEYLQQSLDDNDWQLIHIRNRLKELDLEGESTENTTPSTSLTSNLRPGVSRMQSASPFSDAIAAGKDTLSVVEQLRTSGSRATLNTEHNGHVRKEEDQETFSMALAKEMKAMKDSYEKKVESLYQDIRKVQKLRIDSLNRVQSEYEDERNRHLQTITQLTDRCTQLETQLTVLQRTFSIAQDKQIAFLEQYEHATTDTIRMQIVKALYSFIHTSCQEERIVRQAQNECRIRKLQDHCGSSSVTVNREETYYQSDNNK